MTWLRRILGLRELKNIVRPARHSEFLLDLSGEDKVPARQFDDLLQDRKRATVTLRDAGWGTIKDRDLEDVALLHVAMESGLATGMDWAAVPDEIFASFDPIIQRLRLPSFPDSYHEFAQEIEESANRGDHVGLIFPKLVSWAKDSDLRIINLNGGSDMYCLALLSPALSNKWVGTSLSEGLKLEDPAWQFEK